MLLKSFRLLANDVLSKNYLLSSNLGGAGADQYHDSAVFHIGRRRRDEVKLKEKKSRTKMHLVDGSSWMKLNLKCKD